MLLLKKESFGLLIGSFGVSILRLLSSALIGLQLEWDFAILGLGVLNSRITEAREIEALLLGVAERRILDFSKIPPF